MNDESAPRPGLQATAVLLTPIALLALLPLTTAPATAQSVASLAGSRESMLRQNLVAQQHDYTYLRNTQEVLAGVNGGVLVAVHGNEDLELAGGEVSFPYARPEVKIFLEQLAHAYHAACGEPLVVTSLTRPISRQPWNASPISVPSASSPTYQLKLTSLTSTSASMSTSTDSIWNTHCPMTSPSAARPRRPAVRSNAISKRSLRPR